MYDLYENAQPYDVELHSRCSATLKEYPGYYKITVSKMISQGHRALTEEEKRWVKEGLTPGEAMYLSWCYKHDCVELFGTDKPLDRTDEHIGRYMSNLIRAKTTLDELANCNDWTYFVTLTISPERFDRFDLRGFYSKFSKWVNNYKRDSGCKLAYVFVPEMHNDGAWHLHGLVNNIVPEQLVEYKLADYFPWTDVRLPNYIRERVAKGERLYNWLPYSEKFGYCIIEPLRSTERAANYITKYIAKGFGADKRFKGARLLMPSKGLKRAEKIKKGYTYIADVQPIFDNDFATTFKFSKEKYSLDDVLKYFYNNDNIAEH